MAIILKNLFEETKELYRLELLAGERGLGKSLNWIYVAEDPTNASFLRKDELIISTAVMFDQSEDWLLNFIQTLSEHKTSGLILNIGKYIQFQDISASVLAYCNEKAFPLLAMPWHIHISDITRDYYDRIFTDAHTDGRMDFQKLLYEFTNRDLLFRYVDQKLGDIIRYDQKHHTDLLQTLGLYLSNWGSTQQIAAKSYCHRNTVTNRIRTLKEQFNLPLDDPSERFELLAACQIRDFLDKI